MKKLIAATYAPMNHDKSVNTEIIELYGEFLKSNLVAGAFVNGSTGEFSSLSVDERKLIIDTWAQKKPKDFFLINHVGHTSLEVAKELASHSSDKADALSALSPFYFKPPTIESLVYYCTEIASCAPKKPFYYYHVPELTGANFNMIDFLKVAHKKIPNLAGIKFTKNNLKDYEYCKKFKDESYDILFGVDEVFLSSLPLGAQGWVGSTYNHLAPLYYKIKLAFENNDASLADELQAKAVAFVATLNDKAGFNGAGKSFMKLLGMDCGPSRYPHKTLSDLELEEIKEELELLGIIQFTNSFIRA